MRISTSAAVLSSIFLILILLLSFALRIESISDDVVVANGISVIASVFLSTCEIFALTRTFHLVNHHYN
jgi:fumarate reductase subunit D